MRRFVSTRTGASNGEAAALIRSGAAIIARVYANGAGFRVQGLARRLLASACLGRKVQALSQRAPQGSALIDLDSGFLAVAHAVGMGPSASPV